MKKKILNDIVNKKNKVEFALLTNLESGVSFIYEKNKPIKKEFKKNLKKIKLKIKSGKSGIIDNSNIFVEIYNLRMKIIIVGAVHIAQYLIDFIKHLNFEVFIIDPRRNFSSNEKFDNIRVINKWPDKAFLKIKPDKNTALIALSHDPKIDDPAIKYGLNNNFFYIGALGSKKTHLKRCSRLSKDNFSKNKISKIFGPIGLKLGGRTAPEIALSIASQLLLEINKK